MNALLQEGLMATKNIKHAAIIRKKDLSIKAKSHQFSVLQTLI
jgi:profilin